MITRDLPRNATLADWFGYLLYWLGEGMAQDWRRRGVTHVHVGEITLRLLRMWKRIRRVLEQWRAGTLTEGRATCGRRGCPGLTPPPDFGPLRGPNPQGEGDSNRRSGWAAVLPRRFGWLRSLLLPENRHCIDAFNWLLSDNEEMKAIIAAAPRQIGRVLRPFCHFLGLAVPEGLRLPKRVRDRRAYAPPTPTPALPRKSGRGGRQRGWYRDGACCRGGLGG